MKKLFVIMLCAVLLLAMPICAAAETEPVIVGEQGGAMTENLTTENENATESEISASDETVTENLVNYVKDHFEEISVVLVLIFSSFYEARVRGKMTGSIGTLNNNAIAVANNSATAIDAALAKVEGIANVVQNYKNDIASLLDEIRSSDEEKKALKDALVKVESYLNTAKLANVEFANELAELLCLANLPNSKKDELYKRHVDNVHKLEAAEEVKNDDGSEA